MMAGGLSYSLPSHWSEVTNERSASLLGFTDFDDTNMSDQLRNDSFGWFVTSTELSNRTFHWLNESTLTSHLGIFGASQMTFTGIVVTITILIFIICFTIVGNILVILSVCTYRPLRTAQNFFIVSLAVADLTVAFFVLPFNVAYITMGQWVFGHFMCQLWLTSDILCCTASILNLVAIAIDRYFAIADPINYANQRTLRLVLSMIAGVWTLSLCVCLPPILGWNNWGEDLTTSCQLSSVKSFVVLSSMLSFFVPLVLILIVYVQLFRAIRKRARARQSKISHLSCTKIRLNSKDESVISEQGQNGLKDIKSIKEMYKQRKLQHKWSKSSLMDRKDDKSFDSPECLMPASDDLKDESTSDYNDSKVQQMQPAQQSQESALDMIDEHQQEKLLQLENAVFSPNQLPKELKTTDVVVKIAPGGVSQIHQFVEERQRISLTKEKRAARTLGIIVGVFVVCWLPFFLMYLITPFCEGACDMDQRVVNVIVWLGYINSSLNPVIYTIFNEEFRKSFFKLLRCAKYT